MSAVEIQGLRVGYGSTPVLRDVDLTVPAGTTTAVLGASGCGKTTLLRAIAGFLVPDAGTIRLGGTLVSGEDRFVPPERRGVGYVRQDGGLFPHLDVAGNVTFGMRRAARRRRTGVAELLELVGLHPDLARRRPDELSGGQQQRVALARALALSPKVILLDEPFSSLDTALRASTREAVAAALDETGATAILVTHDQQEALSFADQVAIMRDGGFSQVGTPRDVYAHPIDAREAAFLGDVVVLPGALDEDGVECDLGVLPVLGSQGLARAEVDVIVRPEQLLITSPDEGDTMAVVLDSLFHGAQALVRLRLENDQEIVARTRGLDTPEPGSVVGVQTLGPVLTYPTG